MEFDGSRPLRGRFIALMAITALWLAACGDDALPGDSDAVPVDSAAPVTTAAPATTAVPTTVPAAAGATESSAPPATDSAAAAEAPWILQMTLSREVDGDWIVWFYETGFAVGPGGDLDGSGTGEINGEVHCVSSDGYVGPFHELVGTYTFDVGGSLEGNVFDVEVTGSGSWVEYLEPASDPVCGEVFFDIARDFVGMVAEFPMHQVVDAGAIEIPAEHAAVREFPITDLGTLRVTVLDAFLLAEPDPSP